MRLGLGLPWPRLLGIFYCHVGYFLNQCLLTWSLKSFAFMLAFFGICGDYLVLGTEYVANIAVNEASNYFGYIYLAFVISSMLPLLLEVNLEMGPRAVVKSLCSSLLALNPVFAA